VRAERVTVRPVSMSERLADDRYWRALRRVALIELTPTDEGNLQRTEITGGNQAIVCPQRLIWRRPASLNGEGNAGEDAAQWKRGDDAYCLDSRQVLKPWPQLLIKRGGGGAVWVLRSWQRETYDQHILRLEARIDRL